MSGILLASDQTCRRCASVLRVSERCWYWRAEALALYCSEACALADVPSGEAA